jgi:hypothetical protein
MTRQEEDYLRIGDINYVVSIPVGNYIGGNNTELPFPWYSTGCYRGYTARWEIKENLLFLAELNIAKSGFSFSTQKSNTFASWVSGVIEVSASTHEGVTYNTAITLMLLSIENGKIISALPVYRDLFKDFEETYGQKMKNVSEKKYCDILEVFNKYDNSLEQLKSFYKNSFEDFAKAGSIEIQKQMIWRAIQFPYDLTSLDVIVERTKSTEDSIKKEAVQSLSLSNVLNYLCSSDKYPIKRLIYLYDVLGRDKELDSICSSMDAFEDLMYSDVIKTLDDEKRKKLENIIDRLQHIALHDSNFEVRKTALWCFQYPNGFFKNDAFEVYTKPLASLCERLLNQKDNNLITNQYIDYTTHLCFAML